MQIAAMQLALKERGFEPGPIDGVIGRRTIAALRGFQAANGLAPSGNADPATLAKLGVKLPAGAGQALILPWMEEARRIKGLHEIRDKTRLWSWLRSDGRTLGDPERLPWCGDFVQTAIALTLPAEPLPANPYLARNWMKFGRQVEPVVGAVLVFWRGSRHGTSGHVGFCVGDDAHAYHVLGGNQSNAVTIARLAKDRLLGARWPSTFPLVSQRARLSAGGRLSTNEA